MKYLKEEEYDSLTEQEQKRYLKFMFGQKFIESKTKGKLVIY